MSLQEELLPLVALGVLGSVHCIGMCGGFTLLVGSARDTALGRLTSLQGLYLLGKACTYAILALVLATGIGSLGSLAASTDEPGTIEHLRLLLAVSAGAFLLVTGVTTLRGRGFALGSRFGRLVSSVTRPARFLLEQTLSLPPRARSFGIGVLNGLLPCGLSWAAVLVAARSEPAVAALGAFTFGLATGPALLAFGLGAGLAGARWRRAAPRVIGTLLVVFGLVTLWRSGYSLAAAHIFGLDAPTCCQTAVSTVTR